MNNQQNNPSNKFDRWANKSDEWLVEAWLKESPSDNQVAAQLLQERYKLELEKRIARKLPWDWAADAIQETWDDFYNYITVNKIRMSARAVIFTIAHRRMVDAVRKRAREIKIETDLEDPEYLKMATTPAEVEPLAEVVKSKEHRQVLFHNLYHLLSDCERGFLGDDKSVRLLPNLNCQIDGEISRNNLHSCGESRSKG